MKAPAQATARYPSGWMSPKCLRWLEQQGELARLAVEVGSWRGRSATATVTRCQGTLYCVDRWADEEVHRAFLRNLAGPIEAGRVCPLRMSSVEGAAEIARIHGPRSFDFVFIDADHSYRGVMADLQAYRPLVAPGGLLAGHDFSRGWPGVVRAVRETFGDYAQVGPGSIWSVQL